MYPLGFNVSINFVTLHLSLKPASMKCNIFTENSIAEGNSKYYEFWQCITVLCSQTPFKSTLYTKKHNRLEIDSLSTAAIVCKKATSGEKRKKKKKKQQQLSVWCSYRESKEYKHLETLQIVFTGKHASNTTPNSR